MSWLLWHHRNSGNCLSQYSKWAVFATYFPYLDSVNRVVNGTLGNFSHVYILLQAPLLKKNNKEKLVSIIWAL